MVYYGTLEKKSYIINNCNSFGSAAPYNIKKCRVCRSRRLGRNCHTEINPDYEPWFSSLYEPASGEIESLLFAVQAALGAGVAGFILGRITAKKGE